MDGAEWRQLSIPELVTRRYEFRCRKNLQEVTGCRLLRHKLGKILEQHFQWRGTEKIVLYDDSQPYSFFFEEYTPYGRGICGAVILHGIEDIAKARYTAYTHKIYTDLHRMDAIPPEKKKFFSRRYRCFTMV